jgi:hypothetical protein
MTVLHFVNGLLWLVNAILWQAYAHQPTFAVVSFVAAIGCFFISRNERDRVWR